LTRSPAIGWDFAPWSMLWRLAGVDHLHVNGLDNKFSESNDSVIASARAVLSPINEAASMRAMPVFSSGQTGRQAAPTYRAIGTADLIHTAGGGIFGHPGGVKQGVAALRAAWRAAMEGVALDAAARDNAPLSRALEFWT
jgi:ribulose-bisphosphate carboxylase large chain